MRTVALAQPGAAAADLVREFESRVSPFDVGNRVQLFVDRVLVRDTERVWFTQHQGKKHPANPLIEADRPWEWSVQIYGNVIYDKQAKLFKMWYLEQPPTDSKHWVIPATGDGCATCYATSTDGIQWQKPPVGILRSMDGKPNNALASIHIMSVIKDVKDPDPSRRYKCTGMSPTEKSLYYNTFVSPNGLHWKLYSEKAIAPGADVICGFWDPGRKIYVAFPKQIQMWRRLPSAGVWHDRQPRFHPLEFMDALLDNRPPRRRRLVGPDRASPAHSRSPR